MGGGVLSIIIIVLQCICFAFFKFFVVFGCCKTCKKSCFAGCRLLGGQGDG